MAGWVHQDIARRLEKFSQEVAAGTSPRLMLLMPPRHGKALAVGTLVPTMAGFVPVEHLCPGDRVFGRDGRPVKVVAVSETWRDRELYEVVSDDGASVVVDAEHEWTVRLCRKRPVYKNKTTRELAGRTSPRAPALMTYGAVEYPEVEDLPVHPYVLGIWLGDGTAATATITQGAQDYDFIRTEVERCGHLTTDRRTSGTFGVLDVQAALSRLGVLRNKHIPEQYRRASARQRLDLLQGLVDTDGFVAPDGQVEFCSVNEELARHVLMLVRSLGVKASLIQGDATLNGEFISRKYRVMFYMAHAARLPRKAARCRDNGRTPHRFLTFKPAGRGDTVCIQVDAPDQQYLVGHGYLLTHNSELVSRMFPAWHLGHYPDHEIIACSYNVSLAMSFSRRVKDVMEDPSYQSVFETRLNPNFQGNEEWGLANGRGQYVAAGIGGGIAGKGAHILSIDDPIKNAEEADSADNREKQWDWYGSVAYTRLAPGGGVLVIQCMTGDTGVRMADGSERRLDTLAAGDQIATFDRGALGVSRVAQVKPNGRDSILKITTISGRIVRANGRHPFLVSAGGELKWVRARSLTTGHTIVASKDSAASGKASGAPPLGAGCQQSAAASVLRTTTSRNGPTDTAPQASTPSPVGTPTSSIGTALPSTTTTHSLHDKAACARSAGDLRATTCPDTGRTSSPSITATTPGRYVDCSATTATPESDILELSPWHVPQPGIFDFTLDEVTSVEPDGVEEVFDLQVDRTENFIANGLVSHNTWWHDDDIAGRVIKAMAEDPSADQFEIVKYPAIAEDDEYLELDTDRIVLAKDRDPDQPLSGYRLLRTKGDALHPDRYDLTKLTRIKKTIPPRFWSALYQQNPVPDDGAYFTRDQFRRASTPPVRNCNVFIAWDFAISEKKVNDYTVGAVLLQDYDDTLHVAEIVRFRSADAFFIVESILDLTQRWYSTGLKLGFEDGQIYRAIESLLRKRMHERRMYPAIEQLKPITDKMARARPLQGRMQQRRVAFALEAEWFDTVRNEMLRFPAGVHDDCVDALAWATQLAIGAAPPRPPKEKTLPSWKDKLKLNGRSALNTHMAA